LPTIGELSRAAFAA